MARHAARRRKVARQEVHSRRHSATRRHGRAGAARAARHTAHRNARHARHGR